METVDIFKEFKKYGTPNYILEKVGKKINLEENIINDIINLDICPKNLIKDILEYIKENKDIIQIYKAYDQNGRLYILFLTLDNNKILEHNEFLFKMKEKYEELYDFMVIEEELGDCFSQFKKEPIN